MKRKLFIALLAITTAVCCAFGFAACDDNGGSGNSGNSGSGSSNGENGNTQPQFEKVAGSEGLEYTLSDDGTYYYLSGYGTCTDKDVVVANYYNGKPVTQIGKYTFMTKSESFEDKEFMGFFERDESRLLVMFNKSYIKSVTIPEGITTIGAYAFAFGGGNYDDENLHNYEWEKYYSTLECVTIPKSVTTICWYAFAYCTALKTINFSEGLTTIAGEAFAFNCSGTLESVTLPNSLKTLMGFAFWGCEGLKTVNLGEGIEVIEDSALAGCPLESITIPVSIKELECPFWYNAYNDTLKDIYYKGTKAQWNEIDLDENWDYCIYEYILHCSDGDIIKQAES